MHFKISAEMLPDPRFRPQEKGEGRETDSVLSFRIRTRLIEEREGRWTRALQDEKVWNGISMVLGLRFRS